MPEGFDKSLPTCNELGLVNQGLKRLTFVAYASLASMKNPSCACSRHCLASTLLDPGAPFRPPCANVESVDQESSSQAYNFATAMGSR